MNLELIVPVLAREMKNVAGLTLTDDLRDRAAQRRIVARLDRLTENLRGDWKSVGGGIYELRVDYGPGYRVYYAQDGVTLILLLCGGTKRTQDKDIEKAHAYWKDYQARSG